MTPDEALTRLAASTSEAVRSVLEQFSPGQVNAGEPSVLGHNANPLSDFPAPFVAASVAYVDGVTGGNVFAITVKGAKRLACAMMGKDPDEAEGDDLDEFELSAVSEAMNQMMAGAAGATSSVLGTEVEISPPETRVLRAGESVAELCPPAPHATTTSLTVLGEQARLVQLVPNSFTARMTAALDDLGIEVNIRDNGSARASAAGSSGPSLGGISMRLTAELGRTRMRAGTAVALTGGMVVELDAPVDSPLDLYVNGVRFATGTLLVTEDGDWAVRVQEVNTPQPQPGGADQWPVYSS